MMNVLVSVLLFHVAVTCCPAAPSGTVVVRSTEVPVLYRAVGTVRPRLEADVAAQATGRLLSLDVTEGQHVAQGHKLATIEDNLLSLQLTQARSGLDASVAQRLQAEHGKVGALAGLARAEAEFERVRRMHAQKAATDQQFEQAEATFRQAQSAVAGAEEAVKGAAAAVRRATAGVEEVEVGLGYTKVTAPFAGVVTRRLVNAGDLAWPGRPLVHLVSPATMRVEANVREGLVGHVRTGQLLPVSVDALDLRVDGSVEEITPAADPASRTFIVKVALPHDSRLLPGMFARLTIPTGIRHTVVIPRNAVTRIGQLWMVTVEDGDRVTRRLVRVGDDLPNGLEILSGLREGETLILPSGEEARDDR